jgi:hypothetical protein
MSYDNSQLARVYLHAWQVTGNEFFRTITEEILDYVMREMTYVGAGANDQQLRPGPQLPSNASGIPGFYSTQDADPTPLRSGDDRSKGEEGRLFVWTPDESREVLGSQASPLPSGGDWRGGADAFVAAYGVTPHGNFESKNILELVGDIDQRPALVEARRKLFEAREQRVHPGHDDVRWRGRQRPAVSACRNCQAGPAALPRS